MSHEWMSTLLPARSFFLVDIIESIIVADLSPPGTLLAFGGLGGTGA